LVNKNFLIILLFMTILLFFTGIFMFNDSYTNKKTILLGTSLPLSGINSHLGKDIVVGANAYFSHINARGGIQGKKIELIQYDDKYEPENTLSNTYTLITKDDVFALFGFVGTPTVNRILPMIKQSTIPFIAPYTGAAFLRDEASNNIVNFRSSYAEEIDALVEYLSSVKKVTRFAIFYQNDDYGEEGYIALSRTLEKHHLHLMGEGTYKRNTLSIRHAILEITTTKPEAIILVGAYKPTARFIAKMRDSSSTAQILFAPISFVNADALISELQGNGQNILFSQTIPSYDDIYSKEAVEYHQLLSFYYPEEKPSLVSYESFLAAKATVVALQSIVGTITRTAFLDAIKSLPINTLDNIPLKYRNAQLLNQVYLSTYHDGQFEIIQKYEH